MTRIAAALLLAIALSGRVLAAEPSREYWRLCARADAVAVVRLSVPHDGNGGIPGRDHWADIGIHPKRQLKGTLPPGLSVRYYLGDDPRQVTRGTLLTLSGRPVLVFLVLASNGDSHPALYFEEDGVEPAQPSRVKAVTQELARQQEVLSKWKPDTGDKDFATVKALVDETTTPDRATQAFKGLETLGRGGVSAIVARMDDRRELGVHHIELTNPPGFWEGVRHYGPSEVVDGLDAILNQITGEDFGSIENGGTDAERDHVVAGWRIYDDMLRNHPAALKPSGSSRSR